MASEPCWCAVCWEKALNRARNALDRHKHTCRHCVVQGTRFAVVTRCRERMRLDLEFDAIASHALVPDPCGGGAV